MRKISIIIVTALALGACGSAPLVSFGNSEEPAPVREEPREEEYTWCGISGPGIFYGADISSLDYYDEDDYCDGFAFAYYNHRDFPGICTEFWATSDDDIVTRMMYSGGADSYDVAVGMVDALWVVC